MRDKIYVTYTPTSFPDAFHTAVHYERRDADGKLVKHYIIEVQPEANGQSEKVLGLLGEALRTGNDVTRLGRMNARVTDLISTGLQNGTDPNPPYEVIAEGEDLSPHLDRMQLYAHGVNRAGIAYRGDRQNSNSFASGALRAGELPPATGVGQDPFGPAGELLEFFVPGLNEPLASPVGRGSSIRGPQDPTDVAANHRYLGRRSASSVRGSSFESGAAAAPPAESNEVNLTDSRYPAGDPNGVIWQSGAIAQGGGLAGRIAALAGINARPRVPLPESGLDQDDLTQSWWLRAMTRGPR